MSSKGATRLTRLELEIMEALWRLGAGSVREIMDKMPPDRQLAYTTVQTIVHRLEEKKAVRQVDKVGNAHIFEPVFSKKAAHRRLISDLLGIFGGSARPLMAHLVEDGKLSREDIIELESLLAEQAKKKKNRKS